MMMEFSRVNGSHVDGENDDDIGDDDEIMVVREMMMMDKVLTLKEYECDPTTKI